MKRLLDLILAAAGLLSRARCVTKNVLVVQAMLRSRSWVKLLMKLCWRR